MMTAQMHRGPDGEGLFRDRHVIIGHRRLSIIDLLETGRQPMCNEACGKCLGGSRAVWVTCNGEIYNFQGLRDELLEHGHRFSSKTDTEVLLHGYKEWGIEGLLGRLRGMFAFALWDAATQLFFLVRDPFGIKPLYYASNGRIFCFASQVRALLRTEVNNGPDPAGHAGFFLWGSVPEPFTLYRGIRAIPAGHWLRVDGNKVSEPTEYSSVSKVFSAIPADATPIPETTGLAGIVLAVKNSVAAHVIADVPVGVFLSAGLDSTMIAMCAGSAGKLQTLTLGFDEYIGLSADEVPMASETARAINACHTTMWIRRADFEQEQERFLAAMDQPSIDGVNSWFIARAAATQGLKVALSGIGGDELFGSYPSFSGVPRMATVLSPIARVPALGAAFRLVTGPILRRLTSSKYAGLFEYGTSMGGAYLLRRGLFMPWELSHVLDPDMAREGWRELETLSRLDMTTQGISHQHFAVSALEMCWYMRNQLLRDADWTGMAHSVEIRVPFVDAYLVGKVAAVLAKSPDISKQQVATELAPSLSRALLNRPKTGFSVPVRDWLLASGAPRERGLRGWARHVYAQGGWQV